MSCDPEYTYYIIEALALLAVFVTVAVVTHKRVVKAWYIENKLQADVREGETKTSMEKL